MLNSFELIIIYAINSGRLQNDIVHKRELSLGELIRGRKGILSLMFVGSKVILAYEKDP